MNVNYTNEKYINPPEHWSAGSWCSKLLHPVV